MEQYIKLLKEIKEKGTYKPSAREGMPGTTSLFGYQFRHNLQDGFPLLTTKKMYWKGVVVELLWFLQGDTNIKYLVDRGVNIWNEDAYNYYLKVCNNNTAERIFNFNDFIDYINYIKNNSDLKTDLYNYSLGDCGCQYGEMWRSHFINKSVISDQIKNVIKSLKETPESRRHIVTSIDPSHENDLALYWCHAMFQFNCRPISVLDRAHYANDNDIIHSHELMFGDQELEGSETLINQLNRHNIPKYYLDCQLYQRSADVFLGAPFNIASYALLTEIIAKICNMIPGEFIHTFGDVHIYDTHKEQVDEQIKRIPNELPTLKLNKNLDNLDWEGILIGDIDYKIITESLFNYNPQDKIIGELSTGLKK